MHGHHALAGSSAFGAIAERPHAAARRREDAAAAVRSKQSAGDEAELLHATK